MKKIVLVSVLLVLLSATYAFGRGALFPWAPVKPGFASVRADRALVFYPAGEALPAAFRNPDSLLGAVEQAQRLRFRRPVRIVLADTWWRFNRGALIGWSDDSLAVLGAALQTGTVVYLSPLARRPGTDPVAVLRHELTHALLFQQMPLPRTFELVRLDWFEEGLAVHFGNAEQYYDDATWSRLAREEGYLFHVTGDEKLGGIPPEQRGRFMLAEYRLFIAFLMHRHGAARFLAFRDRVLEAPAAYAAAYEAVLGEPFAEGVAAFEAAVLAGTWPPAPGPSTP